ncbi:hypothetical protein ACVW16_000223 [Bradyrhizobium sp. USDA 4474]
MQPDEREWLRDYIKARLERRRINEEMTREILLRSREVIPRSEELLKLTGPISRPRNRAKSEAAHLTGLYDLAVGGLPYKKARASPKGISELGHKSPCGPGSRT